MKILKALIWIPATLVAFFLIGCQGVPPDVFKSPDDMMSRRQIESRKFKGISEADLLAASNNVLQDMGFNLENSEVSLGIMTASKERDAFDTVEITKLVAVKLLTFGMGSTVISKDQTIRATIVIKPAPEDSVTGTIYYGAQNKSSSEQHSKQTGKDAPQASESFIVRLSLQRIVRRSDKSIVSESIKDPEIYQEFFSKLSKSVFIEAQKI